jgi:hypothetical protein
MKINRKSSRTQPSEAIFALPRYQILATHEPAWPGPAAAVRDSIRVCALALGKSRKPKKSQFHVASSGPASM